MLRDNGTGVVRDNGIPDPLSASMDPQLQEPLNTISNTSINTVLNTSKKKSKYIYPENSVYYSLAKLLRDRILLNRPDLNDPNLQNWSVTIDRMIKYDKRDPEMIKKVIIFAQEDEFWNGNILCAKSLRKQFDRLDIQRLKKEKREQDYRKEVKKYHGNDNDDEYDFFFQRKA